MQNSNAQPEMQKSQITSANIEYSQPGPTIQPPPPPPQYQNQQQQIEPQPSTRKLTLKLLLILYSKR